MTLNLNSMIKSIDSLERSLKLSESKQAFSSEDLQETVRAGVIQNFEVAYEQCWKMIQRWIKENRTREEAEHPRTRKELFRMAARFGLISDPVPWFGYSDARNLTAHTYDEGQASAVYEITSDFLRDARYLLKQLQAGND